MKTILVPTDLSELANNALAVAVDLARTYEAEILLVHFQPFSIARANTAEGSLSMLGYLDKQEDADKVELGQIAQNPAYHGVRISPITVDNADGLYDAMTERGADLIVLGTHGTSGWDELLFGSNAEHIVRAAHCPVLIIKEGVTHFAPRNPVAAIDIDEALKANWPVYPFKAGGHDLNQFVYVSTPDDMLAADGVREWMHELAQANGISDYELHIRQARTVESGILNYATEKQADLLVLYTHGHTGLRHFLQGSIAEDVLNHAPLPVLILRIDDSIDQPATGLQMTKTALKTFVLATDFTDSNAQIADYALALAGQFQARLVIVHAYEETISGPTESDAIPASLKRARKRLMQTSKGSVDVSIVAKYGEPRTCIEAVVAEEKADLLIMALADDRPYTARILGSLPTEMIPQTTVPMLILPPGIEPEPIKTVVLAVDLSESIDALVLGRAKAFVQALGATLAIICMDDEPDPQRQKAAQRIGELFDGLPHTFSFQPGNDLATTLDDYITTYPTDLIMMLPRHQSRLAIWLMESVTQQVARQSIIPVLAII